MELVTPLNHLIFCYHLLFWHSIFPSIRAFSNELVICIRWPKYWSFSFSVSSFNIYSGLIFLMNKRSLQSKGISRVFSKTAVQFSSVQFSPSVMSDSLQPHKQQHARPPCPSLFLESTQTQVHRVTDAIQTSHPLLTPSPLALNLSQHHGLFK